jgi:hypothetical protein
MQRTFTSRQLRQYAQELADKFGGTAPMARVIGCDPSSLSKFLLGHYATSASLLRCLGVHFDVRQGLYIQDHEAASHAATTINTALAEENQRLRDQVKGLRIRLTKTGLTLGREAA